MDSRIGLDLIVEDEEYTTKLGSGKTLRDIHKNRKLSWVVELHTFQSFFVHRKDLVRLQLRDRFWRITAETSQSIANLCGMILNIRPEMSALNNNLQLRKLKGWKFKENQLR